MQEIPWPNALTSDRKQLVTALNARLLQEQNLPLALSAGAGAAIIGALLWMGITVATHMHLGLVAIAIGAGVGFAVQYAGKGVTKPFGVIGGVFALIGCLLGEFLTAVYLLSDARQIDFLSALGSVDPVAIITVIFANSGVITYVIYAIAVWEGYKFSFRKLTQEDLLAAGLLPNSAPPIK